MQIGFNFFNQLNSRHMLKKYLLRSVLVLSVFFLSKGLYGQCEGDHFLDKCSTNLGTYTFVKSFHISIDPAKSEIFEWSYVFSKGSKYMIIVCDEKDDTNRMVINLYDRNHQLVASSYDKSRKKHFGSLIYPCNATGVYYVEANFEAGRPACGVNVLGFSKR